MTNLDCTVITVCPFCGKGHEILVNEDDYYDWDDGKLAQEAFPYLSAEEREMLISGICPTCWDKMFGGGSFVEDEDEDEYDDEEYADNFLEVGYDPYMGCYSDDC